MKPIIEIEDLGKRYIIGHEQRQRYTALRDVIAENAKNAWNRLRHPLGGWAEDDPQHEEFWALRDINLNIKQGERVGIIGRNGAGKSTLLKILSRITHPTKGRITLRGRVASLLEVGTGFHPELTGRENIYLNGAVLGMTRTEITRKFDEIVAFAEVEKFLDTPVKRYSSGMQVRLGFAVAAHLEPEILLVDEVLAVGDVAFQKKCLGKMEDVSQKEGRTVLFVSHNMGAVERLCNKAIFLEQGKLHYQADDVRKVIKKYLSQYDTNSDKMRTTWINENNAYNNPYFKPLKIWLTLADGAEMPRLVSNDTDIFVCIEFEAQEIDRALIVGYTVYNIDKNEAIYVTNNIDKEDSFWPEIKKGRNILQSKIPKHFLNEGSYRISFDASLHQRMWLIETEKENMNLFFTISGGLSNSPYWTHKRRGVLAPIMDWNTL